MKSNILYGHHVTWAPGTQLDCWSSEFEYVEECRTLQCEYSQPFMDQCYSRPGDGKVFNPPSIHKLADNAVCVGYEALWAEVLGPRTALYLGGLPNCWELVMCSDLPTLCTVGRITLRTKDDTSGRRGRPWKNSENALSLWKPQKSTRTWEKRQCCI